MKLVRPLPADRNRPDVLNKRVDYANWFMNHAIVRHCVFVDECGYNIWTARSHGRARQGERAYRHVCGQRGRNLTVTMAISPINRDEARARRMPLGDFRTQQLLEALHRNIDTVTAAKCAQWFRLMQTYIFLPRCLNRKVIEG